MIKALNPMEACWYTPESEKEESNPTRFKIKGLMGDQFAEVVPEFVFTDTGALKNITGKGILLCLNYGLTDWENFANDSGNVKFSRGRTNLLPYAIMAELALEIIKASTPTEEEKKT